MLVNTHEAKTQLSKLLELAAAGEEVIIARAGRPMARLIAYRAETGDREPGLWRGRVRLAVDFDETPEEILEDFAGGPTP